jgi:hypothetical protein
MVRYSQQICLPLFSRCQPLGFLLRYVLLHSKALFLSLVPLPILSCVLLHAYSPCAPGSTGGLLRMGVPHGEGLATHAGLESCVAVRKFNHEASIKERAGMVTNLVKIRQGCRHHKERRKATPGVSQRRDAKGPRAVKDTLQVRKQPAREPVDPKTAKQISLTIPPSVKSR